MDMKTLKKYITVANAIEAERHDLILFALLQRTEANGLWDAVVSAPWVADNQGEAFGYIADHLKKILSKSEILDISRIVLLHPDDAPVINIVNAAQGHGPVKQLDGNYTLNDMLIVQGYVLAAHHPAQASLKAA